MHRSLHCIGIIVAAITTSALGAQRTFVASYGNDANGCQLTTPCRSFGVAITHTDPNGEIVVLDSAGYGRVTIDKSVTITVPAGVYGGLSVFSGTNGVDIATAGVDVVLRGITINGQGGLHGVNFQSGSSLVLENCTIANMAGDGVHATADGSLIYATDTVFRGNANGLLAPAAITIALDRVAAAQNSSTGLSVDRGAHMTLARSRVDGNGRGILIGGNLDFVTSTLALSETVVSDNTGDGVLVQASGNGAAFASLAKAWMTNNLGSGFACVATDSATARCTVRDSTSSRNVIGVRASGAGARVAVSRVTVTSTGGPGLLQENSATLLSRTNNTVHDNSTDTLGTITPLAPL